MQREHAIEPLPGIARPNPYRCGHFNTLAGLGQATYLFKPADPKGRPNQDYLDG
jgi:hypothetical protein